MNASLERTLMKASWKEDNMGRWSVSSSQQLSSLTEIRRGKSGGQVRDEYREEYDPGRGGYGRATVDDKDRDFY
jgi:hypothetical protein